MTGMEVQRERENPCRLRPENGESLVQSGAVDFTTRPINADGLLAKINK